MFLTDLSSDRRDEIAQAVASKIVSLGLEVPAILFLDTHRPLSWIGSQALIFLSPALAPFFGFSRLRELVAFLNERGNVEVLVKNIEELAGAKGGT